MHLTIILYSQSLYNELISTFRNRLTSQEDCDKFNNIMARITRFDPQSIGKEVFFVPTSSKRTYLVRKSYEEWLEVVHQNVTICGRNNILNFFFLTIITYISRFLGTDSIYLDIPVSTEFLQDVANVSRVLSRSGSHLMLCGATGSGHKESLHVVCTLLQLKIVLPLPVSQYSRDNFLNDLRMVILSF